MSMNLSNIASWNICCVDYRCVINRISKSETMGLLKNDHLNKKSGTLKNIIFLYGI